MVTMLPSSFYVSKVSRDYTGVRPQLAVVLSKSDLMRIAEKYKLTANDLAKSAARAVNDVAKTGRGLTRKRVRAYVNLPTKSVNPRVEITKRASPDDLHATIVLDAAKHGKRRRPTLMSFKGRPKKPSYEGKAALKNKQRPRGKKRKLKRKGFTYQIQKTGSRKTLPGGFVARTTRRFNVGGGFESLGSGGNVQAFRRKGRARFPLVVPRGPSIAAMWQNPETGIAIDITTELNRRLPERVQGQARRIYDGRFKKVG